MVGNFIDTLLPDLLFCGLYIIIAGVFIKLWICYVTSYLIDICFNHPQMNETRSKRKPSRNGSTNIWRRYVQKMLLIAYNWSLTRQPTLRNFLEWVNAYEWKKNEWMRYRKYCNCPQFEEDTKTKKETRSGRKRTLSNALIPNSDPRRPCQGYMDREFRVRTLIHPALADINCYVPPPSPEWIVVKRMCLFITCYQSITVGEACYYRGIKLIWGLFMSLVHRGMEVVHIQTL